MQGAKSGLKKAGYDSLVEIECYYAGSPEDAAKEYLKTEDFEDFPNDTELTVFVTVGYELEGVFLKMKNLLTISIQT